MSFTASHAGENSETNGSEQTIVSSILTDLVFKRSNRSRTVHWSLIHWIIGSTPWAQVIEEFCVFNCVEPRILRQARDGYHCLPRSGDADLVIIFSRAYWNGSFKSFAWKHEPSWFDLKEFQAPRQYVYSALLSFRIIDFCLAPCQYDIVFSYSCRLLPDRLSCEFMPVIWSMDEQGK